MDKYAAGDTAPDWECRLFDGTEPYSLIGALSVRVKMWRDGNLIVDREGTWDPLAPGYVTLNLQPNDMIEPGPVLSRVVVQNVEGTQTFPPVGYMKTTVSPSAP